MAVHAREHVRMSKSNNSLPTLSALARRAELLQAEIDEARLQELSRHSGTSASRSKDSAVLSRILPVQLAAERS